MFALRFALSVSAVKILKIPFFLQAWRALRLCPSISLGVLWFEFPHHPEPVEGGFSKDARLLFLNSGANRSLR